MTVGVPFLYSHTETAREPYPAPMVYTHVRRGQRRQPTEVFAPDVLNLGSEPDDTERRIMRAENKLHGAASPGARAYWKRRIRRLRAAT